MLLQSAAEAGPDWLNLPFGRGPRDTVLMQGSPARAGCNKGEDRTALCGSLRVGPRVPLSRWDAADITADGREAETWSKGCVSVVYIGAADING